MSIKWWHCIVHKPVVILTKAWFWTLFSLMSKLNLRRGMVCFQKMHDFLRLSFLAHCCNVTIATSFGIFFVQIIVPYHIVAKYAHFCLGSSFWKYAYFLFWSFLCNNCSLSNYFWKICKILFWIIFWQICNVMDKCCKNSRLSENILFVWLKMWWLLGTFSSEKNAVFRAWILPLVVEQDDNENWKILLLGLSIWSMQFLCGNFSTNF